MNKKIAVFIVVCLTVIGLTACSETEAPAHKLITMDDIRDHAQDYDIYYLHTLLRYLAERHETVSNTQLTLNMEIAESYYKSIGVDVEDALKEAMVKAQVYEELAFLRILGKTYAQVEQEAKNDTYIYDVYQFVVLGGENVSDTAQQLTEALQGLVTSSEVQAVYAEHLKRAEIEVTTMSYTSDTLPAMFSFVEELDAGDAYKIGDDTYAGVVYVHKREKATTEKLIGTYKQYVTTRYPDTMDLIQEYINTLPITYTVGEGVDELIYLKIEGLD